MSEASWNLSPSERSETVRRTAENLFALAYSRQKAVTDKEAREVAEITEAKAYTVARIESETTTGQRPANESLKAYTRYANRSMHAQASADETFENLRLFCSKNFGFLT